MLRHVRLTDMPWWVVCAALVQAALITGATIVLRCQDGAPMPSLIEPRKQAARLPVPDASAMGQLTKSLIASMPPLPANQPRQVQPPASLTEGPAGAAPWSFPSLPEGPPLTSQTPPPLPQAPLPAASPFIERPIDRRRRH